MLMLKRHRATPRWGPFASALDDEDLDADDDCVPDGLTVDDLPSAMAENSAGHAGDIQTMGD
ncbi:MAG TPA: hypothetical protein VMU33_03300 [Burkholderiaceae bacterium]|nr:hypothetical protein [Burkholderiaceae bacterium]